MNSLCRHYFLGKELRHLDYYFAQILADITVVLGVVLILDIIFTISINRVNVNLIVAIILIMVFSGLFILTATYTPSEQYYLIKIMKFLTAVLAFIYPMLRTIKMRFFYKLFTFLVISISLWYLYLLSTGYLQKINAVSFETIKSFYLFIAYCLGIVLVTLITSTAQIFVNRNIKSLIILLSLFALIILGGRGPLIFSILLIGFYFLINYRFSSIINTKRILMIGVILVLMITIFTLFANEIQLLISRSLMRMTVLFDNLTFSNLDLGKSGNEKISHIIFSIDKIVSNPINFLFGYGVGSYGVLLSGIDQRLFPHNILLEIMFEGGIFLLPIFMTLIFSTFHKNKIKNPVNVYVLLYLLLNALKSGTLADSRIFFAFIALSLVFKHTKKTIMKHPFIQIFHDFELKMLNCLILIIPL